MPLNLLPTENGLKPRERIHNLETQKPLITGRRAGHFMEDHDFFRIALKSTNTIPWNDVWNTCRCFPKAVSSFNFVLTQFWPYIC